MANMIRSIKRNVARQNMKRVGFERMNKKGAAMFSGTLQNGKYSTMKSGSLFAKNWREYLRDNFAKKAKKRHKKAV